ncbi:MAG: N-6 DNA methylase [Ilumatobacteraceae bacterium]
MNQPNADTLLEHTLESLGYSSAEGLVRGDLLEQPTARGFVWRELRDKGEVQAAYFRGGVPLVAFASARSRTEITRVHRRLWNLSRVPILIASSDDEVTVFSCFTPPAAGSLFDSEAVLASAQGSDDLSVVLQEFARFHVESGRLATMTDQRFSRAGRVDTRLLENLRTLRSALQGSGDKRQTLDALVGRSMFIRYFEDRGILTPDHLVELVEQRSYVDALEAGLEPTYRLFAALAERFNGDVFGFEPDEMTSVSATDLQTLAAFFRGTDLDTGQSVLWPYDFSVIPPELISSIYEQLLAERQVADGAYYTPRHVVDLVLDEVLPWDGGTGRHRTLDPACGSGIFLTETFRRLAFQATRGGREPKDFGSFVELLTSSIFGVDLNEAAIRVASLGLYLALLEEIDPPTVWRHAHLPRLVGVNLIVADFFGDHDLASHEYDLIVGNPPWQSRLSSAAQAFLDSHDLSVADKQVSMAFLLRSMRMLSPQGRVGLLLPAKPLLHNKSKRAVAARLGIFEALEVETIIDLSILRHETFKGAVAPTVVLVAGATTGFSDRASAEILHVVPRDSPLQSAIDGFVVSQEDVHRVPPDLRALEADIWKILLWGDMRDHSLIARLRSSHDSLGAVAKARRWVSGRGLQVVGGDENDASHLVGMPLVPVDAVRSFRLDTDLVTEIDEAVMHRPRNPRLYQGPHVLIRRGLYLGRPVSCLVTETAAFTDSVIGLAGPKRDLPHLQTLTGYLNSSLAYYYHFLTAASWGVERDYVELNEHLSLPIADLEGEAADLVRAAVRVAEAHPDDEDLWRGQLDEAVYAAYGLNEEDIDRVADVLDTCLEQFVMGRRSNAFRPPSDAAAAQYIRVLEGTLRVGLNTDLIRVESSGSSETYRVVTVRIGAEIPDGDVPVDDARDLLASLLDAAGERSDGWPSPATILQPSLVVLDGVCAHIVKPNEVRYWTRSKARSDAPELTGCIVASPPDVS